MVERMNNKPSESAPPAMPAAEMRIDPRGAFAMDRKVYITLLGSMGGPRYRCEAEIVDSYDDPMSRDRIFTIRVNMMTAERTR